jgi:hypothetical protein
MKKENWLVVTLVMVFVFFLSPMMAGAIVLPDQKGAINDFGGFLTPQEITALEKVAADFAKRHAPSRVIIVTNKEINESGVKMSRRIFSDWKLKDTDILILFSASGKDAVFRIDPGLAIANLVSDKSIKGIHKVVDSYIAKNRMGQAFDLTINKIGKQIQSAKDAGMIVRVFFGLIAIAIFAVLLIFAAMSYRKRRNERKELEDSLDALEGRLVVLGEKVGIYSRKILMLTAEIRGYYPDSLARVNSTLIAEKLEQEKAIRENIGRKPQAELLALSKSLAKGIDRIENAFALVDKLISGEEKPAQAPQPTARSMKKEAEIPEPDNWSDVSRRNEFSSGEEKTTPGSSATQHPNRHGGQHATVIRERREEDVAGGSSVVVIGDLGGHRHDSYEENPLGTFFNDGLDGRSERRMEDRADSQRGGHPRTESDPESSHIRIDEDADPRGSHITFDQPDDRASEIEIGGVSDERESHITLDADPVMETSEPASEPATETASESSEPSGGDE